MPLYTAFSLRTIDGKIYFNSNKGEEELNIKVRKLKKAKKTLHHFLLKRKE